MMPLSHHRESGFALMAVLWLVTLLSLIATGVLSATRVNSKLMAHLRERALAQAAADAGIYLTIADLLEGRAAASSHPDGAPAYRAFADAELAISVQDESGKVDINAARPEFLYAVCHRSGIPQNACRDFVARIVEWRAASPDAAPPAKNRFRSIVELPLVTKMDDDQFQRLAPLLTVHSGLEMVDLRTAPWDVLLAVPGMTPTNAASLLQQRTKAGNDRSTQPVGPDGSTTGRSFSIRAEARMKSGAKVDRTAVVRITGNPAAPYWVYSWSAAAP